MTYRRLLTSMVTAYAAPMVRLFTAESNLWENLFHPFLGRRGPVTFSGTPAEVLGKLRRWQRGLR